MESKYTEEELIAMFKGYFDEQYMMLYRGGDLDEERYRKEVRRFDEVYLKKENDFICKFTRYREDIISSDREAAAFTRAFEQFQKVFGKGACKTTRRFSRREQANERVGKKTRNSKGEWMTVIEYNSSSDITVKFDTGEIRAHVTWGNFTRGNLSRICRNRKMDEAM